MYTASTPIHVDDETRLYVSGTIDRHGACGLRNYEDTMRIAAAEGGFARIGLLSWRRDRLLGYTALWDGIVILKPVLGGDHPAVLALNVDTGDRGHVRVRLLKQVNWERIPLDGYGFEDCETISGDHQNVEVRWKGQASLPILPAETPLVAEVELTRATLWAFDFSAPTIC